MTDKESVMQALKDSLRNQHCGFIENVGNVYALSEETINDTLELLKEQEDLEKKYTALLNEKISELIEENAKLNTEMNQAKSKQSIHTYEELVSCRECIRRGTYNCPIYVGGDADHGSPDDWYCASGERR